jgi:hypothetical protein
VNTHRYFAIRAITLVLFSIAVVGSAGISDGLTDGLISAWTFDDGTATDIKGRNNGILHGDVQFVDGKTGLGVDITGEDTYIEVPHSSSMDAMADQFTHAVWAFVREAGDHAGIVFKGEKIGWGPLFHMRLATINNTSLTYGSNTVAGHLDDETEEGAQTSEGWFNAEGKYQSGEWIHMAQVGTGRTIQAFLNGVPVEITNGFHGVTGTDPIPLTAPYDVFPDFPIEIGISRGQGGNRDTIKSIDGIVDEVAIFRRALSATEIAQLGDFDWSTAVRAEGKLATTWATIRNGAGL